MSLRPPKRYWVASNSSAPQEATTPQDEPLSVEALGRLVQAITLLEESRERVVTMPLIAEKAFALQDKEETGLILCLLGVSLATDPKLIADTATEWARQVTAARAAKRAEETPEKKPA